MAFMPNLSKILLFYVVNRKFASMKRIEYIEPTNGQYISCMSYRIKDLTNT